MGFYDLYRSRMRDNNSASEIVQDDISQTIKDNFYSQPNYHQVYLNDDVVTQYDVLISDGNLKNKTVGYKILSSYPYATYTFDSGDYITLTYGGESTKWLLTTIDKPNLYSVKSAIKRCNNDLKWIDSNGVTQSYKCVIEDQLNDDTLQEKKEIILTRGSLIVTVQRNSDTSLIKDSDRFIFNGNAYKARSTLNFTDMNTITLLMDVDMISLEYDDVINNIANINKYNYSLAINQDDFSQEVGYTKTLTSTLTLDNEIATKDIEWVSSTPTKATVNINTGVISLVALGTTTITARMKDNHNVNDAIVITTVASVASVEVNTILPNVTSVLQGKTQIYTVYNYVDNVASADTFTIIGSGASTSKYTLTVISGNSFSVKSLGYDSTPLTVTCINNTDANTTNIQVSLKGLWQI